MRPPLPLCNCSCFSVHHYAIKLLRSLHVPKFVFYNISESRLSITYSSNYYFFYKSLGILARTLVYIFLTFLFHLQLISFTLRLFTLLRHSTLPRCCLFFTHVSTHFLLDMSSPFTILSFFFTLIKSRTLLGTPAFFFPLFSSLSFIFPFFFLHTSLVTFLTSFFFPHVHVNSVRSFIFVFLIYSKFNTFFCFNLRTFHAVVLVYAKRITSPMHFAAFFTAL